MGRDRVSTSSVSQAKWRRIRKAKKLLIELGVPRPLIYDININRFGIISERESQRCKQECRDKNAQAAVIPSTLKNIKIMYIYKYIFSYSQLFSPTHSVCPSSMLSPAIRLEVH